MLRLELKDIDDTVLFVDPVNGVEDGYERVKDVLVQTELATKGKIFVEAESYPELHARYIKEKIRRILY